MHLCFPFCITAPSISTCNWLVNRDVNKSCITLQNSVNFLSFPSRWPGLAQPDIAKKRTDRVAIDLRQRSPTQLETTFSLERSIKCSFLSSRCVGTVDLRIWRCTRTRIYVHISPMMILKEWDGRRTKNDETNGRLRGLLQDLQQYVFYFLFSCVFIVHQTDTQNKKKLISIIWTRLDDLINQTYFLKSTDPLMYDVNLLGLARISEL